MSPNNLLQLARAGYGAAQLAARQPAPGGFARPVTVLLGARSLAQAALCATLPNRTAALRAGVGVDLLHAASMAGVAVVSRRHRRAALGQVGAALAFAAAGALLVPRPRPTT